MVLEGINQQLLGSDLEVAVRELKNYTISVDYVWEKSVVEETDEDDDF